MLVERCIGRRFVTALVAVVGTLLLFYALLLVRMGLSKDMPDGIGPLLHLLMENIAKSSDILLAVSAPAAILVTFWRLRRSGILLALFAAGLRPARIRRVVAFMALFVFLGAILANELSSRAVAENPWKAQAWRSGDVWGSFLLRPRSQGGLGLVVFDTETLDAWEATGWTLDEATRSFRLEETRVLHGAPLTQEVLAQASPPSRSFRAAPPSQWFRTPPPLHAFFESLIRILIAPTVFLLCAYLSLVLREDRLVFVWVGFLFLMAIAAMTTITIGVLLRQVPGWGVAAALAYVLSSLLLLVFLDRRLGNRGLVLS